jgi:hypothetical protein
MAESSRIKVHDILGLLSRYKVDLFGHLLLKSSLQLLKFEELLRIQILQLNQIASGTVETRSLIDQVLVLHMGMACNILSI